VEFRAEEGQQAMGLAGDGRDDPPDHGVSCGRSQSRQCQTLWAKIPLVYRAQATFHTDQYDAYTGVIPTARYKAITKKARKTNHIERFNNTLRQRVSRLVRDTLSFSKKLANHIGVINYFICAYNLTRVTATACPV
jgi:insertion element IS1 protein InsB